MRRAFERACPGLRVQVAEDGERAVAFLQAMLAGGAAATQVVLDLKLPNLPGLEVLRWIRGQEALAALPVVVLTSSGEKRDVEEVSRLGAQAYHKKPVSHAQLLELVRGLLSSWGLA